MAGREARQALQLILGEGFRRVQKEGGRLAVQKRLEYRQLVAQALAARRAGDDDGVAPRTQRLDCTHLMRVQLLDAAVRQRFGDGFGERLLELGKLRGALRNAFPVGKGATKRGRLGQRDEPVCERAGVAIRGGRCLVLAGEETGGFGLHERIPGALAQNRAQRYERERSGHSRVAEYTAAPSRITEPNGESKHMRQNVRQVRQMLREFVKLESAGGLVLMGATALALICANLPGVSWLYNELLHLPFEARIGGLGLEKDFLHLVNDGLMAVFFLLVGLELKREVLDGQLSDRRTIVLPILAAIGGVALPALIYVTIAGGDPVGRNGWAIPAATDIAFSLGVLSLLGSRVPLALKVFLTTIAIVDDLAAIVIIAIFYTDKLSVLALLLGLVGVGALIVLNRAGVKRPTAYLFVGMLIWFCVLQSGVHATLAGVAVALTIPLTSKDPDYTPLRFLEHALHPWVAYMIIPVFAFANAGISFGRREP